MRATQIVSTKNLTFSTRISASDIMFPFSLREAYISAAFTTTSSVIERTLLMAQNLLKSSVCFSAFFALKPLRISYFVIWEMFRQPCMLIYSEAFANTLGFFLKSSERISVSRSEGGCAMCQCLEKRLLSNASFSISLMSSGESPLYTKDERKRISVDSDGSSSMIRVTFLCSGKLSGETGFNTPSSKIASIVLGILHLHVQRITQWGNMNQRTMGEIRNTSHIFLFLCQLW